MKSLPILCLLFVLIARGNSHSCKFCHFLGKDCTGYDTECPSPEDHCGTVLLEASSAPVSFRSVHKNCFSSSLCKLEKFDINLGHDAYFRGRINCCEKELCDPPSFPGMPLSHPNGYYCPGGLGLYLEDTTEYEAICRGTETKCINIVGHRHEDHIGDIPYNIKGCVSSCPLLSLSNRTHEENRNDLKKIECIDAFKIVPSA